MPHRAYYHNRRPLLSSLVLVFSVIWSGISNAAVAVDNDNLSTIFDKNLATLTTSHATSGTDRLMIVGVTISKKEVVTSLQHNGVALDFVGFVASDAERALIT